MKLPAGNMFNDFGLARWLMVFRQMKCTEGLNWKLLSSHIQRANILGAFGVLICELNLAPCRTYVQWISTGKNLFYGLSAKGSSITNEMHRGTQLHAPFIPIPKGPTYRAPLASLSVNYTFKDSSLQDLCSMAFDW